MPMQSVQRDTAAPHTSHRHRRRRDSALHRASSECERGHGHIVQGRAVRPRFRPRYPRAGVVRRAVLAASSAAPAAPLRASARACRPPWVPRPTCGRSRATVLLWHVPRAGLRCATAAGGSRLALCLRHAAHYAAPSGASRRFARSLRACRSPARCIACLRQRGAPVPGTALPPCVGAAWAAVPPRVSPPPPRLRLAARREKSG